MTVRGFLAWYLGAVIAVGSAGASAYHVLLRKHAITEAMTIQPVAVAEAPPQIAEPPAPAPATATPPAELPCTASLSKLCPPLAMGSKLRQPHRKRVVATHAPKHRPTAVASAHREIPPDSPWAYPPPPPPPPPGLGYAYPARYPYPGYYPYYPRYGYYRSF